MVVSLQVVIFVGVTALASTVSSVPEFILMITIKTYHVNKRCVLLFCLLFESGAAALAQTVFHFV